MPKAALPSRAMSISVNLKSIHCKIKKTPLNKKEPFAHTNAHTRTYSSCSTMKARTVLSNGRCSCCESVSHLTGTQICTLVIASEWTIKPYARWIRFWYVYSNKIPYRSTVNRFQFQFVLCCTVHNATEVCFWYDILFTDATEPVLRTGSIDQWVKVTPVVKNLGIGHQLWLWAVAFLWLSAVVSKRF